LELNSGRFMENPPPGEYRNIWRHIESMPSHSEGVG
jgi:hypothetical protein